MKLLKILLDRRVATAIVSAISAIVCAICAGCALRLGELTLKDVSADIYNTVHSPTNTIER